MGSQNPHIIGLTGSFGSGCSYIANEILTKKGYSYYSLSDALKKMFKVETGNDADDVPRGELQDYGDRKREKEGCDYFSQLIYRQILSDYEKKPEAKYIVDSIRNPSEISCFRENSNKFYLFGIYADEDIRWARVKDKPIYNDDHSLFTTDDKNDKGKDNPKHGQHVEDCFYEADVVIENNNQFAVPGNEGFTKYETKLLQYIDLISNPLKKQRVIKTEETLMAAAYAISQKSSCIRRKVGAVLVDESDNIISSGFNEVPPFEKPCESEYKGCFREQTREKYFSILEKELPQEPEKCNILKDEFKKTFKILDYCRALHAEENTIVNLARNGSSVPLDKCTLYSTTYPCRMCANKIVQANIQKVIYLEPYPDKKGKAILKQAGVKDIPFEGVTFKAYFRLYGEQK